MRQDAGRLFLRQNLTKKRFLLPKINNLLTLLMREVISKKERDGFLCVCIVLQLPARLRNNSRKKCPQDESLRSGDGGIHLF